MVRSTLLRHHLRNHYRGDFWMMTARHMWVPLQHKEANEHQDIELVGVEKSRPWALQMGGFVSHWRTAVRRMMKWMFLVDLTSAGCLIVPHRSQKHPWLLGVVSGVRIMDGEYVHYWH